MYYTALFFIFAYIGMTHTDPQCTPSHAVYSPVSNTLQLDLMLSGNKRTRYRNNATRCTASTCATKPSVHCVLLACLLAPGTRQCGWHMPSLSERNGRGLP